MAKKYRRLDEHEILILDGPVSQSTVDRDNLTMLDVIPAADNVPDEAEGRVFIQEALSLLTTQEQKVVNATILDGYTQLEVAQKMGISQPMVQRIKARALNKLRKYLILDDPISK